MHVDTDDLATLLKMQHLDLEAMRDKKKLEELPQRAVILEARSKKKAIEQKRAQLDALHAKADAQLSRIDDEDRSLSEKQRQVQSEIDAVRGDCRGVVVTTTEVGVHVELYVVIEYGTNINTVSQNLVDQVTFALSEYARVPLDGVEVHVQGVKVRK